MNVDRHRFKHRWRQCQVEQTISGRKVVELRHFLVQHFKVTTISVIARHVVIQLPELFISLGLVILDLHILVASFTKLFDGEFCSGVTEEGGRWWQKAVTVKPPESRVDLLLR